MSNPYNWNFPQKSETMYLSKIDGSFNNNSFHQRESSFQKKDIDGTSSKIQIPIDVRRQNNNYSTYVQPRPDYAKSIKKVSDPLKHRDIEGSYPQAVEFKSNRNVNPLVPHYKLPSSTPVNVAEPAKFMRNSIDVSDIAKKKQSFKGIKSPKDEPIQRSCPKKLFKTIDAVSRLEVKDINQDGQFISKRRNSPIDPLNPTYSWRDNVNDQYGLSFTKNTLQQEEKILNQGYGQIQKAKPKYSVRNWNRKSLDLSLKIDDIDGAKANSSNEGRYFFEKRKDYRNCLKINDIEKTGVSSLKKGITTNRNINPLMPKYDYPA